MDIRDKYQKHIVSGRATLLMMIILTIVNTVLKYGRSNYYFLFSARIPEYIADLGISFYRNRTIPLYTLLLALFITILIIAVYFVCYLFFARHPAFIITASAMFLVDTVLFVVLLIVSGYNFNRDITLIIDLTFHLGVLFIMIQSVVASIKLKKLPPFSDNEQ